MDCNKIDIRQPLAENPGATLKHFDHGELTTALPVMAKGAWMKTWDNRELRANEIKRRWAELYIYTLYQLQDGLPDFEGPNGCLRLIVPTVLLNKALADRPEAQTIQLNELMSILGTPYKHCLALSTAAIPWKILQLVSDHWEEMLAYKLQGDALKRQWYENTYLPSQAKPGKR